MTVLSTRITPSSPEFRSNAEHNRRLVDRLRAAQQQSLQGGGEAFVRRHHQRKKLLARERIDLLLDAHSPFLELSPLAAWGLHGNEVPAAGVVTGIGSIAGTACMIIANDATGQRRAASRDGEKTRARAGDRRGKRSAGDLPG